MPRRQRNESVTRTISAWVCAIALATIHVNGVHAACPFFSENFEMAHQKTRHQLGVTAEVGDDDGDDLKQVNHELFGFHNSERGRRLADQLQKGVITTCEGKISLCFLGEDSGHDSDDAKVPYLPWWDCSHATPSNTDRYTTAKEVSHISLSTYLLLNPLAEGAVVGPDSGDLRAKVEEYMKLVSKAQGSQVNNATFPDCPTSNDYPWSSNCWPNVHLLDNERTIVESAVATLSAAGSGGGMSKEQLDAFAFGLKENLVANLNVAARDRIDTMHNTVMGWLEQGLIQSLDNIVAVACTSHMAGKQDLGVQYLARLLSAPVAGDTANKLIVYEGNGGLPGAMDLLATALVDWNAGAAFFQDPARLNRDALADAAKFYLDSFDFPGLPPAVNPSPPQPVPPVVPPSGGPTDPPASSKDESALAVIFGVLFFLSAIMNVAMGVRLARCDRQLLSGVKMMFRRGRAGSDELGQGRLLPLLEAD